MVHLLPSQNMTLQPSATYFLLHQRELPAARCFPWDSEQRPARAVSLNPKGIVAILHVRMAGQPPATVSAKPAEKS